MMKDVIILLPYIGLHSNLITKRLKSCVSRFYSFVNVKVIFQTTRRIKSFFPYKDRLNRSQLSKVIYKTNCWDCKDFYIGKTKRRLHDRKTEHFKALSKHDHSSAIADHVKTTGHNMEWMKVFNMFITAVCYYNFLDCDWFKKLLFPTNSLVKCYRTVCYRTPCYRTVCYRTVQ